MAKRKRSTKACHRTTIKFKTKRGKTIAFSGKTGAGCGPRPKPKTGHLRHFKAAFKAAAKHCKGKPRGAFLNCMKTQTPR
jgi:hypothetical protein